MIHVSEMWALNAEDTERSERNKVSILCYASVHTQQKANVLREKRLGLRSIRCRVQER